MAELVPTNPFRPLHDVLNRRLLAIDGVENFLQSQLHLHITKTPKDCHPALLPLVACNPTVLKQDNLDYFSVPQKLCVLWRTCGPEQYHSALREAHPSPSAQFGAQLTPDQIKDFNEEVSKLAFVGITCRYLTPTCILWMELIVHLARLENYTEKQEYAVEELATLDSTYLLFVSLQNLFEPHQRERQDELSQVNDKDRENLRTARDLLKKHWATIKKKANRANLHEEQRKIEAILNVIERSFSAPLYLLPVLKGPLRSDPFLTEELSLRQYDFDKLSFKISDYTQALDFTFKHFFALSTKALKKSGAPALLKSKCQSLQTILSETLREINTNRGDFINLLQKIESLVNLPLQESLLEKKVVAETYAKKIEMLEKKLNALCKSVLQSAQFFFAELRNSKNSPFAEAFFHLDNIPFFKMLDQYDRLLHSGAEAARILLSSWEKMLLLYEKQLHPGARTSFTPSATFLDQIELFFRNTFRHPQKGDDGNTVRHVILSLFAELRFVSAKGRHDVYKKMPSVQEADKLLAKGAVCSSDIHQFLEIFIGLIISPSGCKTLLSHINRELGPDQNVEKVLIDSCFVFFLIALKDFSIETYLQRIRIACALPLEPEERKLSNCIHLLSDQIKNYLQSLCEPVTIKNSDSIASILCRYRSEGPKKLPTISNYVVDNILGFYKLLDKDYETLKISLQDFLNAYPQASKGFTALFEKYCELRPAMNTAFFSFGQILIRHALSHKLISEEMVDLAPSAPVEEQEAIEEVEESPSLQLPKLPSIPTAATPITLEDPLDTFERSAQLLLESAQGFISVRPSQAGVECLLIQKECSLTLAHLAEDLKELKAALDVNCEYTYFVLQLFLKMATAIEQSAKYRAAYLQIPSTINYHHYSHSLEQLLTKLGLDRSKWESVLWLDGVLESGSRYLTTLSKEASAFVQTTHHLSKLKRVHPVYYEKQKKEFAVDLSKLLSNCLEVCANLLEQAVPCNLDLSQRTFSRAKQGEKSLALVPVFPDTCQPLLKTIKYIGALRMLESHRLLEGNQNVTQRQEAIAFALGELYVNIEYVAELLRVEIKPSCERIWGHFCHLRQAVLVEQMLILLLAQAPFSNGEAHYLFNPAHTPFKRYSHCISEFTQALRAAQINVSEEWLQQIHQQATYFERFLKEGYRYYNNILEPSEAPQLADTLLLVQEGLSAFKRLIDN